MTKTLSNSGEFGLIDLIRGLLQKEQVQAPEVTLGIGDDAASFRPGTGRELLVTCDCMVEGSHYLPEHMNPSDLGRRAMVMNISDIGAMGGRPRYATVSLGLRPETNLADIKAMYRGFITELRPFKASIIGGNITKTEHSAFIDITLIGEVETGKIVRRSTARPGDRILVTGYPGQAAAGLRLLREGKTHDNLINHPLVAAFIRPSHRAVEGQIVAQKGYVTSMIDISDGLLGDLGHICEQSNVGADIFQDRLPSNGHMKEYSLSQDKPIYHMALRNSDDYELIMTCLPENMEAIKSELASLTDTPVTEIGRINDKPRDISLIRPDNSRYKLFPTGWDHFIGEMD